jgi:hypothetical protein
MVPVQAILPGRSIFYLAKSLRDLQPFVPAPAAWIPLDEQETVVPLEQYLDRLNGIIAAVQPEQ